MTKKGLRMQVTIQFSCDNAAFEDAFPTEIRRLLAQAASRVVGVVERTPKGLRLDTGEKYETFLRDTNGNTCGNVVVKGD